MPTIEEIQKEIIEEFEDFSDWEEKYTYIIELGNELKPLEDKYKVKENIVKGCQSQVWLISEYDKNNNKVIYKADSDALIVKGLVSILLRIFSNQSPEDIIKSEVFVFDKIGLKNHISPSRANGLSSMLNYIKNYAMNYIKGGNNANS
ncbi:MAG: Fe-S metabolism protein SufE [Candidatus Sericytochromatia bacterium]|nr:MAG: Fe-S metabolism protein SufE [Candidatus Sericytochromatia bacterium]